jgi:hypothetical protein
MDLLDGPAYLLHTITVWAPISKGPHKVEYYVEISGPAKLDDRPSNPGPEQPSLRALRRCSPTCQQLTRARLRVLLPGARAEGIFNGFFLTGPFVLFRCSADLWELLFSAFSGEVLPVRQSRIRVGPAQVSYSFSFFLFFIISF